MAGSAELMPAGKFCEAERGDVTPLSSENPPPPDLSEYPSEKSLNQVGQGTFLRAAPIPSSRFPRPSILLLSCTVRLYLQ